MTFEYKGSEALEIIKENYLDWEIQLLNSRELLFKIMIENNLDTPMEAFELYLKNPKSIEQTLLLLAALHLINLEKLK